MKYLNQQARMARVESKAEASEGVNNLVKDTDEKATKIVEEIRKEHSLTNEVGILRKTIVKLIAILRANNISITEDLTQFEDYNTCVENAKTEAESSEI